MSDPREIFLAPECSADPYGDGRMWCEDDAWDDYMCECGKGCKSVRYVLDEHVDYGVRSTGQ